MDQAQATPIFVPVVLAGGSGERFWPLSRRSKPKQFLTLDDTGRSLLQATVDRLSMISDSAEAVMVVTGNEYRSQVLDQLPEMPIENLIIEPLARDTAPAVLYAALRIARDQPDAVMGVFPADHRITDTATYLKVIERAVAVAQQTGKLITIGIAPTFPATGYGYIQQGLALAVEDQDLSTNDLFTAYHVSRFAEKPNQELAQQFLDEGGYSWNSGMFVWTAKAILHAFEEHQPEMYRLLTEALKQKNVKQVFPKLEKISIDYAILEKSQQVAVIPAEFGWDDLGDWNALERLLKAEGENVSVGRHVGLDTGGAILYTTNGDDLIVTIGLEDVVIVRTSEVTLVVRQDRTQDIKKVVRQLKAHSELERFA